MFWPSSPADPIRRSEITTDRCPASRRCVWAPIPAGSSTAPWDNCAGCLSGHVRADNRRRTCEDANDNGAAASYSPGRAAPGVHCPLLVQVATRDAVTPPGPAERTARRAVQGELVRYPIGHFDIYVGEPFERAVADQLDFLARHVNGAHS